MQTREERVLVAQRLRASGWKFREIAAELGVSISTACAYVKDPDSVQLAARRERYRQPCPKCGTPMDGSNGTRVPRRCQQCRRSEPYSVDEALNMAAVQRRALWTDEELLDALRQFQARQGSCVRHLYERLAPHDAPSASTIINRFGSWNEGKRRAQLDITPPTREHDKRISDEQLLGAIRFVAWLHGGIPTNLVYTYYRERIHGGMVLARTGGKRVLRRPPLPPLPFPSDTIIRLRFDGWANALRLAFRS